jgi:hypothetical protein
MEQEREPSRRLTEEESGRDVHHGGQQEAAEEEGVEQEAGQREGDQQVGPEQPATD